VELATDAATLPSVEAALEAAGALSVSLADPGGESVLEPAPGETPLWSSVIVTALFEAAIEPGELRSRIARVAGVDAGAIRAEILPPRDWVREFREALVPMRYGERLWICPDGVPCPDPRGIVISLEPGLAFGSGSHATTALCLGWLSALELSGRSVLDWGCGSGVLAIAALALGAERATALDIDRQALLATRENAERNRRAAGLIVSHPDELAAGAGHDVLVANILANTLIGLAPRLRVNCRSGAPVALSGILVAQAPRVRDACAPWFELEVAAEQDGWALLAGHAT